MNLKRKFKKKSIKFMSLNEIQFTETKEISDYFFSSFELFYGSFELVAAALGPLISCPNSSARPRNCLNLTIVQTEVVQTGIHRKLKLFENLLS